MNARQLEDRNRFNRVLVFSREHPAIFAAATVAAKGRKAALAAEVELWSPERLVTDLSAVVEGMDGAHVAQETRDHKAASIRKGTLREKIQAKVRAIRGSVKFIAAQRGEPELLTPFGRISRVTDGRLIAFTQAALNAIAERGLEPALIQLKHSPDFVSQLRSWVEEFVTLSASQGGARQMVSGATRAIEKLRQQGQVLVQGLDGIVRNSIGGDAEQLGAWESASRAVRHTVKEGETGKPGEGETGKAEAVVAANGTPQKKVKGRRRKALETGRLGEGETGRTEAVVVVPVVPVASESASNGVTG